MTETRSQLIKTFISSNKWKVMIAMVAALINSILNVFIPLSIGKYFDLVLDDHTAKGQLIERTGLHIEDLSSFFILFFSIIVLRGIFSYIEIYFTNLSEEHLASFLRERLFNAQLSHKYSSFTSKPVSKYMMRYSNDLSAIRNYLSKGIIKLVADVVFILFALGILFQLNAKSGLIVMIAIIAGAAIMTLISTFQKPFINARHNTRSALLLFIETRLNAFETIKVFNRNTPESNQFRKKNNASMNANEHYFRFTALTQTLLPLIFFIVIGILLLLSIPKNNSEAGQLGSYLLVFILLMLYMQGVFKRIMRVPSILVLGKSSFENLVEIINLPAERNPSNSDFDGPFVGQIEIRSLKAFDSKNQPLFKNLSCQFNPGTISCIVGQQGSGKTTLFNLLLGLKDDTDQAIFIDGKSLNDIAPFVLRQNLTLVSDKTPLIGNTVFRAISYSGKEEKREKVSDMLTKLGISFQQNPEENLDFNIGNGGSNLSSGNKKLLQFARAFLTRKKIILLDEPFAQLDKEQQSKMTEQLNALKIKRTIIIASSVVPENVNFDQIIQL